MWELEPILTRSEIPPRVCTECGKEFAGVWDTVAKRFRKGSVDAIAAGWTTASYAIDVKQVDGSRRREIPACCPDCN